MELPEWLSTGVHIVGFSGGATAATVFARFQLAQRAAKKALVLARNALTIATSTAKDFDRLKTHVEDEIARWKRGSIVDSPLPDAHRISDLAERVAAAEARVNECEKRVSACEDDLDTHAKEDARGFLEIAKSLAFVEGTLDQRNREGRP